MSGVQAELARRERATRRSALEDELAQLQQSFHQRLAGDRSAGEMMIDPSFVTSPVVGSGNFSLSSAVGEDADGAPRGTPRQRVHAADRRHEKRLEQQAQENQSVTRIQSLFRGHRARKQTRSKMARKRDVRCLIAARLISGLLTYLAVTMHCLYRRTLFNCLTDDSWKSECYAMLVCSIPQLKPDDAQGPVEADETTEHHGAVACPSAEPKSKTRATMLYQHSPVQLTAPCIVHFSARGSAWLPQLPGRARASSRGALCMRPLCSG